MRNVRSKAPQMIDPVWSQWGANAGRTFHLDVEPIRTQPRVVWAKTLNGMSLLPSSQAVVAVGSGAAEFLDPANGVSLVRPRGSAASGGARPAFTGAMLLVPSRDGVGVFDVPSGKRSWTFNVPSVGNLAWCPGIVATSKERTVRAWTWSGDAAPSRTPRWEFTFPKGNEVGDLFAADSLVVAYQRLGDTVALDSMTGEVRWRTSGDVQMLDAHGAIVHGAAPRWTMVEIDGRERYANNIGLVPRALSPAFVACEPRLPDYSKNTTEVNIVDRKNGAVSVLGTVYGSNLICAMARDVLYARVERDAIAAFALPGGELWRVKIPHLAWEINDISIAPARLYGTTGNGRSFCLA